MTEFSLFEVSRKLLNCIKVSDEEYVDEETGEIIDEEAIDALEMTYTEKIENIGRWIKNLDASASALKGEEKKMAKRRKACENKMESLKKYLSACMNEVPFESPTVSIKFRKSKSVDVDMTKFMEFDGCDDYLTYAEPSPDKRAIKAALTEGKELPGCSIVEKVGIQIK